MECPDNPRITIVSKPLVAVQEESEARQHEEGDCLGADFVSTLPEQVHLDVSQNDVSNLRNIWESWGLAKRDEFTRKYGDIVLLLSVKVDPRFLRAIVNFWDPSYRCFSFNQEDLTPTLEEYSTLLRIQSASPGKIYQKGKAQGSIQKKVSRLLGIDFSPKEPYEASYGIPWAFLQDYMNNFPEDPGAIDAFALAIYGLIIFPKRLGYVETSVLDLFGRLDKHVNPVPAILAETIRSLNSCRRTGKGRIMGCVSLLYVWARSHFWGKNDLGRRMFREDFSPIAEFCSIDWTKNWGKK